MEQTKLDRINGAWENLAYQFPRWPTTYSQCRTCPPGKEISARGGTRCVNCSFEELRAIVGEDEANEVLTAMHNLNKVWCKLYDKYSGTY